MDDWIPDDWLPIEQNEQPRKFVERRKKQDWVVKSVTIIAILGWVGAIVALSLIYKASPAQEDIITRLLKLDVVSFLNIALLRSAFIAVCASFVISVVGFLFNMTRHRRKTDRYNRLLIAIVIASTLLFVIFLVFYSKYL